MTIDSLKRAARTFIVVFLGLFIPGLLGWLNDLTSWAKGEGSTPFPDAHGLAYLLVVAIVAGLIALLNLVLSWLEDVTGVRVLRDAPAEDLGEGGQVAEQTPAVTALHGDPDVDGPELGES